VKSIELVRLNAKWKKEMKGGLLAVSSHNHKKIMVDVCYCFLLICTPYLLVPFRFCFLG
jgi:hypothetical protein